MEKYLSECINSVMNQTLRDFEIILVDDGSTDSSGEICDQYSGKYNFIHTIHQKNQGLSEARNTGIRMAQGNYLVFLDSDDFIKENGLAILSNVINEKEPDVVINNYYSVKDDGELYSSQWNVPKKWNCSGEVLIECSSKNKIVLMACCIVVKRQYLERFALMFYPGIKHEDELWIPQVIISSENIVFNEKPYYCYRVGRIGSITQKLDPQKIFDKLFVVDQLVDISQNQKGLNRYALEERCAKIVTGTIRELNRYCSVDSYKLLSKEVQKRLHILKGAKGFKYKVLFLLCVVFGAKNVSVIWNI